MSDWIRRLEQARPHVRPNLVPQRMQAIHNGIDQGLQRQRTRRAVALAGAVGLLLVLGAGFLQRTELGGAISPPIASTTSKPAEASLMVLADGSTVQPLDEAARIESLENGAARQAVRLAAGKARFEVTPRESRSFEVHARDVTVTVLGTAFTVAIEASAVHVHVERGSVRVSWPGGMRELRGGEQAAFDTPQTAAPAAEPEPAKAPAPEASGHKRTAEPSWRSLAHDGDYKEAYARMNAGGGSAVQNDPEDLLLAADVARLGGAPGRSVALLERVVRDHAADSRAPLAAFTLGRVLLDQLGRPREAAAAFARARRLAPGGALAQDALAREVESWSRAGEAGLARKRASEYVERFPKGRRQKAVRRFGGLD